MAEEEAKVGGAPCGGLPPGVPEGGLREGVLEVEGAPPGAAEELLVLYFESRRRSGGGPVRSCQRLGSLLFLTFEESRDAQNVLARGSHCVGGTELRVRLAPPWDPTRLLLGGSDPRPPPELLEQLLGRPRHGFELDPAPAPGWGLLRLRDPISAQELVRVVGRAQQLAPALVLLRLPRTPSVLVRVAEVAPTLSPDLLELYFENRRSGGGTVRAVQLLPGGRAAIITFQELDAVERVLQRPHQLQDTVLTVNPHYPFLESPVETPAPDTAPLPDTDPVPDACPDPAEPLPLSPAALPGGDVATERDQRQHWEPVSMQREVLVPAEPVSVQDEVVMPAELWVQDEVLVPTEPLLEQDEVVIPAELSVQDEVVVPAELLVQDEVVVPAEPGVVRYLQRHYRELLDSIPEVLLVPLEGGDVAGYRVSGEPGRCRAAAELLQSLLDTVSSLPATLQLPGVARFLWDKGGQSLLQQLENSFQCVIELDGTRWKPPDPQPELVELLLSSCRREPPAAALPGDAHGADDAGRDGPHSSIEEIKELLAALRPGDTRGRGDPDAEPLARELPWGTGVEEEDEEEDDKEDEEAAMLLAIQRSMESTRREEEELARATKLSLLSYCQEEKEEEEDAGLLAALKASLEEALPAADTARVTVFCSFELDVADVLPALQCALEGQLRVQEVASEQLQALPGQCLTLLRHRHAVSLVLRGGTATLRGFTEYVAAAARDLATLLQHLPQPELDPTATAAACWVRWDPSGTAVPYEPEAAVLLEQAWLRQEHRLDLQRDGRPFTVDLERMEEYDIGNASVAAISRSQPPTHSLLGLETLGLDEEVKLMSLAEDSEEFGDTVRHFYRTLEDQHGKISIIKVQKLIHPLLYQQYRLKKASMERGRAGATVERVLFHGTTESSSREICLHGFNRSFCGKNATLYGLGVYFAAAAALSVQERYSPPSANGTKYIFVAKVLTGEFTTGRPGLRAPPLRDQAGAGTPPRRYDSVVDNPRCPGIFVIFNDTQAYPQYLISCRRGHGGPL